MTIRKHIPNLLTCINLMLGFYACVLALTGVYYEAMLVIFLATVFDFADGLAARLLNAYSPIGKDLDSLADVVSFGVAPGMIVFDFLDRHQYTVEWSNPLIGKMFLLAALAVPVFSALRLAKFNNDARQSTSFIGLPVPAHALFWAPLIYVLSMALDGFGTPGFLMPYVPYALSTIPSLYIIIAVALIVLGSSLLLVSEIPMFSMKIKSADWKGNEQIYTLIIISIILILLFGFLGITMTILIYVAMAVFKKYFSQN
ncbi:MAG: CDP-alcohol phosphatidyltransferase family protein [Tannerella sp.]|nr:CDP-alcohol phosphatidyltransferase family protein [Tannerella sp.]